MRLTTTTLLLLLLSSLSPKATTFFWDANGTTGCGGAGNWGSGPVQGNFWGTSCDTALGTWNNANLDSASLGGTGATITLTNAVTLNKLFVTANSYMLNGTSTLTFSGPGAGVDWNFQGQLFQLSCPFTGSLLTKTGNGRLALNSPSTTVSKYLVQGGEISTASTNRFGLAPGSLVPDFITLDGGGWGIDTISQDLAPTRGITLNSGGGYFGSSALNFTLTISSPITGVGGFTITGGGPFVSSMHAMGANVILANTANDYQGGTTLALGSLRLTAPGVIPDSSTVTVSGGAFDLSGFVKTVTITSPGTGYISAPTVSFSGGGGSGASASVFVSGGGLSTILLTSVGSNYTSAPNMIFSGSGSGAAATANMVIGPINETVGNVVMTGGTISGAGATLTATNFSLSGSPVVSAVMLAGANAPLSKSGSGNVVLNAANTYGGKTTVTGGTLQLSTDAGLGTAPGAYVPDQITLDGGGLKLNATAASLVANRGITLGAGGGTIDVTSGQSPIINGPIIGVGALTKITSGNLDLVASNSFSGGMVITGGGVRFRNDFAAGTGTITVTPASIVTLRNLNPPLAVTLTNPITLNANGGNDIDLTAASGATFTLAGNISGVGYLTRGRASGSSGNVVLSGNNSGWSGGLFWGRGQLTLGHKNALGTGALTCTNLVPGESNVLTTATALTGANAVSNAVNLTGLMIVAGMNNLELSGPISLAAGGNTITNLDSGVFAMSGIIGGPGALAMAGSGATLLSGTSANTYAGGTTVSGSLEVQKDGGLSSGNVTVNDGASLKLGGGTANSYLASAASLLLNGSATVNLAFTGTPNTINALSFDGGTTFKAAGTWGAIGSGAQHTDARFTGTGLLNVLTGPTTSTTLSSSPNPSTYGNPVTFTATVTASAGTPAGTVTFFDGVTPMGTSPVIAGVASLNTAGLTAGGSPHSITAGYNLDNDFAGSTSSAASQVVNPVMVTATVTVSSRAYDGTTAGVIATRSLAGVIGSDEVNLGASGTAAFANKNIGVGKAVSVTGLALSGTAAGNYTLAGSTASATADITAISLTASGLSASSKVYDGNTAATLTGTAALSAGVVGAEDVTLSGTAAGLFADKAVGSGKAVTVSGLSLTGADIGNYTFADPVLSADITAAALTASGITANNKTYDGTTNATVVVTNAALNGVIVGDGVTLLATNAIGAFQDRNVGVSKTVSVTRLQLAGLDSTNYSLTQPTTTADITAALLAVTGLSSDSKTYDQGTGAVTTGTAGLSGVIGAEDVSVIGTPAGNFADKNVGIAKVVSVGGLSLAGADIGNYSLSALNLSADINQLVLTQTGITAQNKVYDGTTAVTFGGTMTVPGIISGDSVTLSGSPVGSFGTKNAGSGISVSFGGVFLTGPDAGNYDLQLQLLSADITSLATSNSLVSSMNPSEPGSNVTFTATLAGTPPAADAPTGDVVFSSNGTPFSTNALVAGVASASIASLPTGTNTIAATYAGDLNFLGSVASLQQVVAASGVCSAINTLAGISDNSDGTFTLTFQGTPQAQYYIVSTTDITTPMESWAVVTDSTNAVTNLSGAWSFTVTNGLPQQFYRSAAVAPCP